MMTGMETVLTELVQAAALLPAIRAIGISGGERPFPEPGEGDIDIFLYCIQIPEPEARRRVLASVGERVDEIRTGCIDDRHWGIGDGCMIAGVETWLLYFAIDEARAELEDILGGKVLGRVDDGYYPLGRCAMWKTMRALYDPDGLLQAFRDRLEEYPVELARAVTEHHLAALQDVEDLERAVRREDVFFYHFAFELALDHFLQALFAMNRTFFPSRKRSEQYIRGFQVKPRDCTLRLKQALAWGAGGGTLRDSYALWQELVRELGDLALS